MSGKHEPTLLLLWNVVGVARAFATLILRRVRIAAGLARCVVVLHLRLVRHEQRLARVDERAAQAVQLRQLRGCGVEARGHRCERVAVTDRVCDGWNDWCGA